MRKLLLVAMGVLAITACGDSTGPDGGSITGTYNLQTVNGASLPFTVLQLGADRLDVISGSVILNTDLRYTTRIGYLETVGGVATTSSDASFGTYTETNGAIRLTSGENGLVSTGAVVNGTLTLTEDDESLVFKK